MKRSFTPTSVVAVSEKPHDVLMADAEQNLQLLLERQAQPLATAALDLDRREARLGGAVQGGQVDGAKPAGSDRLRELRRHPLQLLPRVPPRAAPIAAVAFASPALPNDTVPNVAAFLIFGADDDGSVGSAAEPETEELEDAHREAQAEEREDGDERGGDSGVEVGFVS